MKKKLVRIVSLVLCLVAISALCVNAYAAYSYPSLSESNYCEFIADDDIPVYQYSTCRDNERGTCSPNAHYNSACIYAGDDCRIYKITSKYIKVNYPIDGGGRRTGYIRREALDNYLELDQPYYVFKSRGKVTTHYFVGGWFKEYGYTEKNDTIYCCKKAKNPRADEWIPIMYTAKSGNRGYKLGWVTGSDYLKIKS